MVYSEWERNRKTVKLRTGDGTLTLACSNLFALSPRDREFVLELLAELESYENNERGEYTHEEKS